MELTRPAPALPRLANLLTVDGELEETRVGVTVADKNPIYGANAIAAVSQNALGR
jgi:hypothetical protein